MHAMNHTTLRISASLGEIRFLPASVSKWVSPSIFGGSLCVLFLLILVVYLKPEPKGNALISAPNVGPSEFLSRWYFSKHAWDYIEEGYSRVSDIGSLLKTSLVTFV